MAEKASAYNDCRRGKLKEHKLYQDFPGTAVYEFLGKKGSEYQFRKRDILNPRRPKTIRVNHSDLSFLVPISEDDVQRVEGKTRVTLHQGPPYVRSP